MSAITCRKLKAFGKNLKPRERDSLSAIYGASKLLPDAFQHLVLKIDG
jgi:hypothetical protein